MNTIKTLFILWFFLTLLVQFAFGITLSTVKGLSLKNISIYMLLLVMIVDNIRCRIPIIQSNKVNLPIIVFVVYCFLSLLVSHNNNPFLYRPLYEEIIAFKSYMDPFLLTIIFYSIVHDVKTIKNLLFALMIIVFLFNLIYIMDAWNFINAKGMGGFMGRFGRATGPFGNPNSFAVFLALFLPNSINAVQHVKRPFKKILHSVTIILSLYSLLLTGSRGGCAAFFVGLVSLFILKPKRITHITISRTVGTCLIIVFLLISMFYFLPSVSKEGLTYNVVTRAEVDNLDEYTTGRLDNWQFGLQLFSSYPIFGSGWGTYSVLNHGRNSHSAYIFYLSTTGIVGFLSFLLIFFRIYQSVAYCRRQSTYYRSYYNSYLAGFFAFLTSMTINNILSVFYFFFIYSALVLKLGLLDCLPKENPSV
jgi:O-antigen ligase